MTARDKGHVEEIIMHLKRVENDYKINLTSEMEWLRDIEFPERDQRDSLNSEWQVRRVESERIRWHHRNA